MVEQKVELFPAFFMPCLCQKPRSPFWMAKFRAADGRVVMRSTKQKEYRKALKVALKWEDASRLARTGELTQAASVKILRELLEATSGETLTTPSIKETMRGYLSSRGTLGRSASTSVRYKPIIDSFLASLPPTRTGASVASLGPLEIERWRDAEVAAGKAPKTVNVGLSVIRAALNTAKRRGEILTNPAEAVEAIGGVGEQRVPFTDTEISALLKQAKGTDWHTAILFGALTGLRLADVGGLSWGQVDMAGQTLTIRPDKTDKPLAIYLADELHAHLATLERGVGKAPILPTLHNRITGRNGGLSNEFGRLMKNASIVATLGREKTGKGRRVSGKSFHSLRHAFVSRTVASGAGDSVVKSMTGHSTDEAFRRYVHLGLDQQRTALLKLPKFGGVAK